MISGDFETVTGEWAWRGEAAMFVEKTLQGAAGTPVKGRAFDAGVGVRSPHGRLPRVRIGDPSPRVVGRRSVDRSAPTSVWSDRSSGSSRAIAIWRARSR